MPDAAVQVNDLRVSFRGVKAVYDVTLSVSKGQRRVVVGPNGAGKTTLFNAIAGQVLPDAGDIHILGKEVTHLPPHQRARAGIGRTFQITNLLPGMTVSRNVELAVAGSLPMRRSFLRPLVTHTSVMERTQELLEQWDLKEIRGQTVAELGYGRKRVLEIVMCLASSPKVLLLDEPTAGLSSAEASLVMEIVGDLPRSMTIMMIEHDLAVAFGIADQVSVLVQGQVLATGSPKEVEANDEVVAAYLGEAHAAT